MIPKNLKAGNPHIVDNRIMSGPAGTQQTTMGKLVIVELGGMTNALIDGSSGLAISRPICVTSRLRKHSARV